LSTSHTTVRFDERLRLQLPDSIRENPLLDKWLDESRPGSTELAADAIKSVIRILGRKRKKPILDRTGFKRISQVIDSISKFEGLIQHVRTRFRGKIYRDHLDHMLRTALIGYQLATDAGLAEKSKEELILAAILHDAGYPLQESSDILRSIEENVRSSYSILEFEIKIRPDNELAMHTGHIIEMLSTSTGMTTAEIRAGLFDKPHHTVVGAIVFLQCCREISESAVRIASAICLHHSQRRDGIRYEKNPLAVLLTIADELQDWGRPTSYPIGYPGGLHAVSMRKLEIHEPFRCVLRYSGESFPLFDVIYSKYMNLRRIRLKGLQLQTAFHFPITHAPYNGPRLGIMMPGLCDLIEIERHSKNPWRIVDRSSLSDKQVSRIVSMDIDRVARIRKILPKIKPSEWDIDWFYRQYRSSGNYLVTDQPFTGISTERTDDRLELYLNAPKSNTSGSMIHLNNPPRMSISNVFRVLPVLIGLHPYIVESLGTQIAYRPGEPGSEVSVYWFAPKKGGLGSEKGLKGS
jgi:hypothetical protein